ncbi:MAG: SIS domain-containing protein [Oscillospiraceae bacterium]|nr:SIS domain-containing protein [Oscillospiraceae bacterium]
MVSMLDCICRVPQILSVVTENSGGIFSPLYKAYGERAAKADEIVFIGSGTSNTASITARYFAEKASGVRVSAIAPSEFLYNLSARNPNALYVFISQTGTSILTNRALDYVKERGFMHGALSESPDTPLAKNSGVFIDMRCGYEEYPMRTIGYSATVLTLMLLGAELGEKRGHISGEEKDRMIEDAKKAISNIRPVIDKAMAWLDTNRRAMLRCDGLFFYGSGALYGVALEGAVKVWETPQIISVGYELEEGIHGPNYGFNHRHCVIVLNDGGIENAKAVSLAKYMKLEKNGGFIVGASPVREDDLAFEPAGGDFCCLEFAAAVQVIAYRLAEEQGRDLFAPHDNSVMDSYFKSHA